MHVRAPAKLNLRLRVLAREESGYHQLESLFCAVALADELEVEAGGSGIDLTVLPDAESLGRTRENLVYRAAAAFFDAVGREPAVRIRLRKRIPVGAGLGGGSSDAAVTLRALNDLHDGLLDPDRMRRLGAALGSDVPFFLAGTPFALGWGRGDRLLALPAPPSAPVVIVAPDFRMSTPEAFRRLAERRAAGTAAADPVPCVIDARRLDRWDAVAGLAVNDFEPLMDQRFPVLAELRAALARAGARMTLLTGSGSAIFGIFGDAGTRDRAAEAVAERFDDMRLLRTTTLDRSPD